MMWYGYHRLVAQNRTSSLSEMYRHFVSCCWKFIFPLVSVMSTGSVCVCRVCVCVCVCVRARELSVVGCTSDDVKQRWDLEADWSMLRCLCPERTLMQRG